VSILHMILSKTCILTFLADMSIVNFISTKPQFAPNLKSMLYLLITKRRGSQRNMYLVFLVVQSKEQGTG